MTTSVNLDSAPVGRAIRTRVWSQAGHPSWYTIMTLVFFKIPDTVTPTIDEIKKVRETYKSDTRI